MRMAWPRWVSRRCPWPPWARWRGKRPRRARREEHGGVGGPSARAMESILRSPPDISGPLARAVGLQDGKDLVGEGQPARRRGVLRTRPRRDLDVLGHRQIRKDATLLRRETPARAARSRGAPLVERHVVEADAAAPGAMVAHDGAQGGGLPRAVAPHQADHSPSRTSSDTRPQDMARLDVDVDFLDGEHSGLR